MGLAALLTGASSRYAQAKETQLESVKTKERGTKRNGTFHFKILVPAVAAGAIIGKGGETIALLQKEAGARVKMSKSNDFYPGTTERVCLITGSVEGVLRIHEFIMEKIKEKPDPTAKIAIDFDHKQPAEREKQVKILVPNSTAGMIIGKGGSYIKQIKEESGAYVQISQKSKDHALAERCITVIGEMDNNKKACHMILAKIVEDPQSGSCLHVSYAEVTGPVANFNPTGSPYANPSSVHSTVNNSSASYSSSGSLNSLSPTANFGGAGGGGSLAVAAPFPGANVAQLLENVKAVLRSNGYTEQATADIATAMGTLATYGVLGSSLGALLAGANGALMGQGPPPQQQQQMYPPSPMDATPARGGRQLGHLRPRGQRRLRLAPLRALPQRHGVRPLPAELARAGLARGGQRRRHAGQQQLLRAGHGPGALGRRRHVQVPAALGRRQVLGRGQAGPGSGAAIQISKKGTFAPGTRNRIVSITGTPNAVSTAQYLIEQQIAEEEAKRSQQNALGVLR
ncbi:hypothetical protein HPB48_026619 [Haemaphysalis longicornis]|uniref:K Homology domain-containing protein n=1 Tax=Haemaphysalis longicornis TaxID=44386 RepID=A0A9J6HA99_HAELO|nr:hypothetical protein HPB48_026619 [Haemaphysalis longicornis]